MKVPKFVSEHFTFNEVTSSEKAASLGIDNSLVDEGLLPAIYRTATGLEKVRNILHGVGIHVNSWYRSPLLNAAVGSHSTSQHMLGQAVDFTAAGFGTPLDVCKAIVANKDLIRFDQLIFEHTWVHISFCSIGKFPRGQVLTLLDGGKYATGLTTKHGIPL
jgi:hypothetical protein